MELYLLKFLITAAESLRYFSLSPEWKFLQHPSGTLLHVFCISPVCISGAQVWLQWLLRSKGWLAAVVWEGAGAAQWALWELLWLLKLCHILAWHISEVFFLYWQFVTANMEQSDQLHMLIKITKLVKALCYFSHFIFKYSFKWLNVKILNSWDTREYQCDLIQWMC